VVGGWWSVLEEYCGFERLELLLTVYISESARQPDHLAGVTRKENVFGISLLSVWYLKHSYPDVKIRKAED
jgi:hypothetical protein